MITFFQVDNEQEQVMSMSGAGDVHFDNELRPNFLLL